MKLSGSRLFLAALCPASFGLPSAEDVESTDAQASGTGRHAYLSELARAFSAGDPDPTATALATVPEGADWRPTCMGLDTSDLLPGVRSIRHDVAYAYDVSTDTARELEVSKHRAYGEVKPTELSGTLDWRVTDADGNVVVIDFKGQERVTPARENLQLGFYALAVARVEGLDEINVAIVYIDTDGSLEWDRASLDRWDLAAIATKLSTILARVEAARAVVREGGSPDTHPGLHCARCPALRACPAHVTLARAFVQTAEHPQEHLDALVRLSDEDAGKAWISLDRMRAVLDAVEASLKARARSRPLPLPDGSRIVACESHPRSLDLAKALPVLETRVGDRAATYIKRSLPNEVVTNLARELAPGLGLGVGKATELLWSELEAAGAVKQTTVVSFRARAAKAGAP